jgi:hypothetical protein
MDKIVIVGDQRFGKTAVEQLAKDFSERGIETVAYYPGSEYVLPLVSRYPVEPEEPLAFPVKIEKHGYGVAAWDKAEVQPFHSKHRGSRKGRRPRDKKKARAQKQARKKNR